MAKPVDWYYHRTSCTTCARSQAHLTRAAAAIGETTSANKVRFGRDEALALARRGREVVAMRGPKVVRLRLAEADDDALAAVLLGPHGTLRAPALRVGETLVIGYDPAVYDAALG